MPRPYASGLVPAPASAVWELVRGFDGLPGWHPAIESSELTSGSDGAVGAVRRLVLAEGGGEVVERLVALDDEDRRYTYAFEANPFDVRRYVSTVRVAPITATGQSFVEWWSDYDADGADEERLTALFADGVYAAGIAALAERFT